ncbi:MAG: RNA-binding protein [Candidatus Binatus sp.]
MKLFFGNIRDMSERELRDLLQPYDCSAVWIMRDRGGQARGYAFAEVADSERCILDMEGMPLNSRRLHVAVAKERAHRQEQT